MYKREWYAVAAFILLIGGLLSFTSCEPSTRTDLEESFASVHAVTPIADGQNTTMELAVNNNEESYFSVTLADGITREGWCVEWNEPSVQGIQEGVNLYSTKGHEEWKELNYLMSIKEDLKEEDPEITFREMQVAIWSLVDNPSFEVDKISEYKNIDPKIFNNGVALFNMDKVKEILKKVDDYFKSNDHYASIWEYFVVFIQNKGQTIMVGSETAFAYGGNWASCFLEMPDLKTNRWGWSNGPLDEGEYEFDIYAAAGQCDLDKGVKVGVLEIDYEDGTAVVTFRMTEESPMTNATYTMTATHLYVNNNPLPTLRNDKYTVAPGSYGNIKSHDNVTEYTYTIEDLEGDIYIIAHADVNGFEASNPD